MSIATSRKLNSMLSMWYGLVIGSLHVYLIVHSVRKFVQFVELPWPYQQTPCFELNSYIALVGITVLLLPFYITSSFLQIGNLANDSKMLGKSLDFRSDLSFFFIPKSFQGTKKMIRAIWRHFGPISSTIHVVCSSCLLLAQTLMDGALIKYEFLGKENVWRSDLDVMVHPVEEPMVIKPIGGKAQNNDIIYGDFPLVITGNGMRLEFVNYALALFIFSVRYAQVFWHSQKMLAVLLGAQQIANSILSILSFSAFTLVYKVHATGIYSHGTSKFPFLLNHNVTLLLQLITSTILFLSPTILYYYGYQRFSSFVKHKVRKHYVTSQPEPSASGLGWAYFPHCAALSTFLALAASESPVVHDAYLMYQLSGDNCLFNFVVAAGIHLLLWTVLWFSLLATQNWAFQLEGSICKIPVPGLSSVTLTAEVGLGSNNPKDELSANPLSSSLVVIKEGKAFTISNGEVKDAVAFLISNELATEQPVYYDSPIQKEIFSKVPAAKRNGCLPQEHITSQVVSPFRNKVSVCNGVHSGRKQPGTLRCITENSAPAGYGAGDQVDEGDYAVLANSVKQSHIRPLPSPMSNSDSSSGVGSMVSSMSYSTIQTSLSEEKHPRTCLPINDRLSRRNSLKINGRKNSSQERGKSPLPASILKPCCDGKSVQLKSILVKGPAHEETYSGVRNGLRRAASCREKSYSRSELDPNEEDQSRSLLIALGESSKQSNKENIYESTTKRRVKIQTPSRETSPGPAAVYIKNSNAKVKNICHEIRTRCDTSNLFPSNNLTDDTSLPNDEDSTVSSEPPIPPPLPVLSLLTRESNQSEDKATGSNGLCRLTPVGCSMSSDSDEKDEHGLINEYSLLDCV